MLRRRQHTIPENRGQQLQSFIALLLLNSRKGVVEPSRPKALLPAKSCNNLKTPFPALEIDVPCGRLDVQQRAQLVT